MRIILTGERRWIDYTLTDEVVNRLLAKYGHGIIIVHGGFPGIDACVANACQENNCQRELYLADFSHAGDYEYQNQEMLSRGAEMCVILHRGELDLWCEDLVRQAIDSGVPTYLIDSADGVPRPVSPKRP
jgi:YspA, cpYpsA-related SLOG family